MKIQITHISIPLIQPQYLNVGHTHICFYGNKPIIRFSSFFICFFFQVPERLYLIFVHLTGPSDSSHDSCYQNSQQHDRWNSGWINYRRTWLGTLTYYCCLNSFLKNAPWKTFWFLMTDPNFGKWFATVIWSLGFGGPGRLWGRHGSRDLERIHCIHIDLLLGAELIFL